MQGILIEQLKKEPTLGFKQITISLIFSQSSQDKWKLTLQKQKQMCSQDMVNSNNNNNNIPDSNQDAESKLKR